MRVRVFGRRGGIGPLTDPLVREAAARSLPVVDGLELLVRQGALSFTRWTALPAPLDAMRAAVRP